jgi:2-dehydro-3-deoxy-D-arabinonate dehydratase
MKLYKLNTTYGVRWALDNVMMISAFSLGTALQTSAKNLTEYLHACLTGQIVDPNAQNLAPIDGDQEVWASGVTYMRSRDARMAESSVANVYDKVYDAQRPELFFKTMGWRVVGTGASVRIRKDSTWNVPEPEVTLVINTHGEIVGYTIGNDLSSRDIEGENPLYLPQAKMYNGACALGNAIHLITVDDMRNLSVGIQIYRSGQLAFNGATNANQMKRKFEDLVSYLYREMAYPNGCFLMTGTGVVPPESFTLSVGDVVKISIGELVLENPIA